MANDSISAEREQRLNAVIASCLEAIEAGQGPDRQQLLARYPEFLSELTEFFAGIDQIDLLAKPARAVAAAPQASAEISPARSIYSTSGR
jgi:hypothetical protein